MVLNSSNPVLLKWGAAALAVSAAGQVQAQERSPSTTAAIAPDRDKDGGGNQSNDIIVTAERRETTIQKTPVAISAVAGEELRDRRLQVLRDLATEVPSLVTPGMHATMQSVFIRGIGTSDPGVYPAVGLYIDDVYIPRQFGNGLFDLPDNARVEVLRGPQGTLYGQNTSGGAIKFVSRNPGDTVTGHVDAGFGNYGAFDAHAYLAGPIAPGTLSASIAYTHRRRDGYTYDAYLDKYVDAISTDQARIKLRWMPGGDGGFEAVLSADGTIDRSDNANYVPLQYPGGAPRRSYSNIDQGLRRNIGGITLHLTQPLNDSLTLKSITAYRAFSDDPSPWDQDATPLTTYGWTQFIHQDQVSEEFQILGELPRLTFVVGGSYFHEKLDFTRNTVTNNKYLLIDSFLKDDTFGIYGQATYKLTDKLGVTAGLRFNHERQSFSNYSYNSDAGDNRITPIYSVTGLSADWNALTPKLSVDYQWSPRILSYLSYTQGQKSGGFNRSATTAAIARVPVDPEKVTTYEFGLKSRTADGKAGLNIAVFYNKFDDYIASVSNPQVNGQVILGSVVVNAARARTYGAEVETFWRPLSALQFSLSGAYLDATFEDFANPTGATSSDFSGNRLPSSPRWLFGGSASLTPDIGDLGEVHVTARGRYVGGSFSDAANRAVTAVPEQVLVDLSAKYQLPGERWSITGNINNLVNDTYRVAGSVNAALNVYTAAYNPPRTFLVSLNYDF